MKRAFMILFNLGLNKGGKTSAVLNRSTQFYNHGYGCDLITFNYDYNYTHIVDQLMHDEKMDKRTNLYNLYIHFEEKSFNQDHKQNNKLLKYYKSLLKNTLAIQQSKYTTSYFSKTTGSLVALQKNSKYTDDYTLDIYENELRIKKIYHKSERIERIRYFNGNGELVSETFYDRNSNPYVRRSFDIHENSVINGIYLFPDKKHFKNNTEFCSYFLDDLIEDTSDNIIICDGAGSFPKIVGTHHQNIKKYAVLHSNHYTIQGLEKEKETRVLRESDKIDGVILLTESQKRDVIAEYNVDNAKVISNFIKLQDKRPDNRDSNKKVVGSISRLVKNKGFDDLIKIAKKVTTSDSTVEFHIYGEGPYKDKINDAIQENNLQENVKLMGYTTDPDGALATFDAVISTSQIEGQGLSIIEAMLQENPVIVYDVRYGPSDFIIDQQNGFLIENHDKEKMAETILNVLHDKNLADKIGKNARSYIIDKYDTEKIMHQWTSLFK